MIFLILSSLSFSYVKADFIQNYNWGIKVPQVVICHDSKVSKQNLTKAINFWSKIGYKVNPKIKRKYCNTFNDHQNEIRFTGERGLDTSLYYGMTYRNKENWLIKSATIRIENSQSDNLKLIIHELGHALGIEHSSKNDTKNIMHYLVVENEDTVY